MCTCVRNQLDISSKRISILRSLIYIRQQPNDMQHMARRLESERKSYMLVEVLALVVLLILPIASMSGELPSSSKANSNDRHTLRPHDTVQLARHLLSAVGKPQGTRHPQAGTVVRDSTEVLERMGVLRFQSGYALINHVWSCLEHGIPVRRQLHAGIVQAREALEQLGASVMKGPTALARCILTAQGLLAEAGVTWVRLVCQLPPKCTDTAFMHHIQCQLIESESLDTNLDQPVHSLLLALEADECVRECLIRAVRKLVQHEHMQPILKYFQEMARPIAQQCQLQDLVRKRELQQGQVHSHPEFATAAVDSIQSFEHVVPEPGTCPALQQQGTECCELPAGGSYKGEKDSEISAAATKAAEPVKDVNLDDMQALLTLMYGCSAQLHNLETP